MAVRESRNDTIDPPFYTRGQALGYAALLLALLVLPLVSLTVVVGFGSGLTMMVRTSVSVQPLPSRTVTV